MNKVLVERELLPCPFCGSEAGVSKGGRALCSNEDCIACELFAPVEDWNRRAQPAEAEGVDFGFDDRSVKVSQEAYSIFLARERHHLAALSAVTAERDRLLHSQQVLMQSRNAHRDERDQLRAAISDPEAVFVNMKRGTIAKPSLRSMIDLYGEVVNGEDAQLLEIARLRAIVEGMLEALELAAGFLRNQGRSEDDPLLLAPILAAMAAAENSHG